jgi:hypothetical protein
MNKEEIIFCMDSSALIDLHKFYGQKRYPELWIELDGLCDKKRIISHRIVYDELFSRAERPSDLSKWVASKRDNFFNITFIQAVHVSDIISKFPRLIDPYSQKDQADPWLIALVLEHRIKPSLFDVQNTIAVVSQEDNVNPSKIPAVCRHYEIQHLNLFEFFDANGWKFRFGK